jgi:hypothetical protein
LRINTTWVVNNIDKRIAKIFTGIIGATFIVGGNINWKMKWKT